MAPEAKIFDISTGKPVEGSIPVENVQAAVESGKFALPPGDVSVISPEGKEGTIPAENAAKAFAAGYKYASPEAAKEAKYGSTRQQVLTGIEGAAEGLAGPLGTMAVKALGAKNEDIVSRRETNPGVHMAGQAAGLGVGALSGVGEARVLGAAGKALATSLPKRLAIENALFAAGDETSKLITHDPSQSASSAIANIGLSTVLGGGLGKAAEKAQAGLSAAKSTKAAEFLDSFKSRVLEHMGDAPVGAASGSAQKAADYLVNKGIAKTSGASAGAAIGHAIGQSAGAGALGAFVGEKTLGPLLEKALPALAKNILGTEASPSALRSAIAYAGAVAKGERLANTAVEGLFKPGSKVLPEGLHPSEKKLQQLQDHLDEIELNPLSLMDKTGDVGYYLPDHPAALGETMARASQYLKTLKPSEDQTTVLGQKNVPNDIEKSRYNRALSMAEQPLMLVQHLKDGSLTPEDMKAAMAIHPNYVEGLKVKIMNSLTVAISKGEPVPYKLALNLGLLLGHPLDASTQPQNMTVIQAQFMPKQPESQLQQNGSQDASNNTGLNKLSQSQYTASQSREAQRISQGSK